jgi:TonB family protein
MKLATPAILAMLLLNSSIQPSAQHTTPAPQTQGSAAEAYTDSTQSLQSFLGELLAATKAGDRKQVSSLISKTEIPNEREWFLSMYPKEKAETWIEPYEKDLPRNEGALQQFFERISGGDGQFLIQKQSEVPNPGNSLIWAMLDNPNPSPEAYLANWKSAASADPRPQFIGFFYFLDGAFRWNSLVHVEPRQPVAGCASAQGADSQTVSGPVMKFGSGIIPPRVIHSEEPQYTASAKRVNLEGTAVLSAVIDIDGCAKQVKVTRPIGQGLDAKAVEALQKERFSPATSKGQPVPFSVVIQMRLRLYKDK